MRQILICEQHARAVIKVDVADLGGQWTQGREIGTQLELRQIAALTEFKQHYQQETKVSICT